MYRIAICEDDAKLNEALGEDCCGILSALKIEYETASFFSAEALDEALSSDNCHERLSIPLHRIQRSFTRCSKL